MRLILASLATLFLAIAFVVISCAKKESNATTYKGIVPGLTRVKCIKGHYFVINIEGGVSQIMYRDNILRANIPMRCR